MLVILRTIGILIALCVVRAYGQGSTPSFSCTRYMPEISNGGFNFTSTLMWTYDKTNDLLTAQLTLAAGQGWVGVGFHGPNGYVQGDGHNGTTFLIGYPYNNGNSCVRAYYGEVRANASLAGGYPTRLNFTEPNYSNTSISITNQNFTVMKFVIHPSTISGFQPTGPYLLVGLYWSINPTSGMTCPAAEGSLPKHQARDTNTPRVVFNDHNWLQHDGVNCTPAVATNSPNNNNNNGGNQNNNNNNNNNNGPTTSPTPYCTNVGTPKPSSMSPPSAACQNASSFKSASAAYQTCAAAQCACMSGNYTNGQCQGSSAVTCATLNCQIILWKCVAAAVQPLMSVSACSSVTAPYSDTSGHGCLQQACQAVSGCADAVYAAICSVSLSHARPAFDWMNLVAIALVAIVVTVSIV